MGKNTIQTFKDVHAHEELGIAVKAALWLPTPTPSHQTHALFTFLSFNPTETHRSFYLKFPNADVLPQVEEGALPREDPQSRGAINGSRAGHAPRPSRPIRGSDGGTAPKTG